MASRKVEARASGSRAGIRLLLRAALLRRQPGGVAPRGEHGYSMAVAIIAVFVLLLGVAALASRTQFGFVGQVFQTSNRQARDVAETAMAEFANTLNREENRYILIAGNTTNWATSTNLCTRYAQDGTEIQANPTPVSTGARFLPSNTFTPLVAGDPNRRFRVETIEYLDSQRNPYDETSSNLLTVLQAGGNRSLIRVTLQSEVEQNGRVSAARISKEFEVVPKCCKRSFGQNQIGATNWGRDNSECDVRKTGEGDGIIVGLGGGGVDGSNNTKQIFDENGNLVTQSLCWAGSTSGDLTGVPNPECLDGSMALGSTGGDNTGISFVPKEINFTYPPYNYPSTPVPGLSTLTIGNNQVRYVTSTATNEIRVCQNSGGSYANCTLINGNAVGSGPDPCYQITDPADPNYEASRPSFNCQLRNINMSNPGSTLRFDTTRARINVLFYDSAYTGVYLGGQQGSSEVSRVQCTGVNFPTACTTPIQWATFQLDENKKRLNFYANGTGAFNINGNVTGVGYNIYAPLASVSMKGGGGADPNFMGQLWVNDLYINGNVKINTFASVAGGGAGVGLPLIDFMARSFTQSSGFGFGL